MKMKLTREMLAQIKREPDDATLADWVVDARIIEQGIKDAKALLHERIEVAPGKRITAGCGVTISQVEQGGTYSVTAPLPLYAALTATLPANEVAKVVEPSVTRLKDTLARVMNIPKTGQAPQTAESVFKAKFLPHMTQGTKRIFKYSNT